MAPFQIPSYAASQVPKYTDWDQVCRLQKFDAGRCMNVLSLQSELSA
jgi:hypothetical protein